MSLRFLIGFFIYLFILYEECTQFNEIIDKGDVCSSWNFSKHIVNLYLKSQSYHSNKK